MVSEVGGVQAQVMSAAELQIAVRAECNVADVRQALWQDRSLVKTWLMRGTLHLVAAADLPVYTAAMTRLWKSQMRPSWLEFMETSEAEFWRIVDDIGLALDGTPMTREELIERVGKGKSQRIRELLKSGWGGMLKPAARAGCLCFGPNRGQSVTFVRPEAWMGSWRHVDPEVALRDIVTRYLRAYGPATKTDFARWWGAWPGVASAAWSALPASSCLCPWRARGATLWRAILTRFERRTSRNRCSSSRALIRTSSVTRRATTSTRELSPLASAVPRAGSPRASCSKVWSSAPGRTA